MTATDAGEGDRVDGAEVARRLTADGVDAAWEHPGFVRIRLDDVHEVATGAHGWDYGTVSTLVNGAWEPVSGPGDTVTVTGPVASTAQVVAAWAGVATGWAPSR